MRRFGRLLVAALPAAALIALVASLTTGSAHAAEQPAQPLRLFVVPDTQNYLRDRERIAIVNSMFDWIVAQADPPTQFVSHVGDVVDDPYSDWEWDTMAALFVDLETAGLAYGISPGNHDLGSGPVPYDTRFAQDRFAHRSWFGGSHDAEGNRSNYATMSVAGRDWLFVHVRHLKPAYGDIGPVLEWLGSVLADHPHHLAVVTTHEFTGGDGGIRIPKLGQTLAEHCNVVMVHSGHWASGAARGSFQDRCGRTVHHMLTNYQNFPNGGEGWLRILDIDPATLRVDSVVYSPSLGEYRTGSAERFTIELAPLEPVAGDATCDHLADSRDAVAMLDYLIGNRAGRAGCPIAVDSEISLDGGDLTDDARVQVDDAWALIGCLVGQPNVFCSNLTD